MHKSLVIGFGLVLAIAVVWAGEVAITQPATQPTTDMAAGTSQSDPFLKLVRSGIDIKPATRSASVAKAIDWQALRQEARKTADPGVRTQRVAYVELWKRLAQAYDYGINCSAPHIFERNACGLLAGRHDPHDQYLPYADLGIPTQPACDYLLAEDLPTWAQSLRPCAAAVLAGEGERRGMVILLEAIRDTINKPRGLDPIYIILPATWTPKALPLWAEVACDADAKVRLVAIRNVAATKSEKAVDILLPLLKDGDREVRIAAAVALMPRDAKDATPVLLDKVRRELDGKVASAAANAPICVKLSQWNVPDVPWEKIEAVLNDQVRREGDVDYWRAIEVAGCCLAAGREKLALPFLKSAMSAGLDILDQPARLSAGNVSGTAPSPADTRALAFAWHAAKALAINGRLEGVHFIRRYIEVGQNNWTDAYGGLMALAAFLKRPEVKPEDRKLLMAIAAKAVERCDILFQGYPGRAAEALGEMGALVRVEQRAGHIAAVETLAMPYDRRYGCQPGYYCIAAIYQARVRSVAVAANQDGITLPSGWLADYEKEQQAAIAALAQGPDGDLRRVASLALEQLNVSSTLPATKPATSPSSRPAPTEPAPVTSNSPRLTPEQRLQMVKDVLDPATRDEARLKAVCALASSDYCPEIAEALAVIAASSKYDAVLRWNAAEGLRGFAHSMPKEVREPIRQRLRDAVRTEQEKLPNGPLRVLLLWGDADWVLETLGDKLRGRPEEVEVLGRISSRDQALTRLWELYRCTPVSNTDSNWITRRYIGMTMTDRKDKRGIDILLECLTAEPWDGYGSERTEDVADAFRQNVHGTFVLIAGPLHQNFGYAADGHWKPQLAQAIPKMVAWWKANRETWNFDEATSNNATSQPVATLVPTSQPSDWTIAENNPIVQVYVGKTTPEGTELVFEFKTMQFYSNQRLYGCIFVNGRIVMIKEYNTEDAYVRGFVTLPDNGEIEACAGVVKAPQSIDPHNHAALYRAFVNSPHKPFKSKLSDLPKWHVSNPIKERKGQSGHVSLPTNTAASYPYLKPEERPAKAREALDPTTGDRARFDAVWGLAISGYSRESAEALAALAVDSKHELTVRDYAAMGLSNFTTAMPKELRCAIQDKLYGVLETEKDKLPDCVIRTLTVWGDGDRVRKVLGDKLRGHRMEVEVLRGISSREAAVTRLWELYEQSLGATSKAAWEKEEYIGLALIHWKDKRGIDILLDRLTARKEPWPLENPSPQAKESEAASFHQCLHNTYTHISRTVGKDFGYEAVGNYRPEVAQAIPKMAEWWKANRETWDFDRPAAGSNAASGTQPATRPAAVEGRLRVRPKGARSEWGSEKL